MELPHPEPIQETEHLVHHYHQSLASDLASAIHETHVDDHLEFSIVIQDSPQITFTPESIVTSSSISTSSSARSSPTNSVADFSIYSAVMEQTGTPISSDSAENVSMDSSSQEVLGTSPTPKKIKPPVPKKPVHIPPPRRFVPKNKTLEQLQEMELRIVGASKSLTKKPLILEAEMIKITPTTPSLHWRHVFLFHDQIILIKPIRKTGYFQFADEMSLLPAWIVETNEGQLDDKTFQIHNFEETLTLRAENKFVKQVWVNALKKVLIEIQKKFPRLFEMPHRPEYDEASTPIKIFPQKLKN